MKRIQTSTAVPDLFGSGKPGFTNGNPLTGIQATDLEDRFFNGIQEAIVRVIEDIGETLSDDPEQYLRCLKGLIQQNAGIRAYALSALPSTNVGPIVVTDVMEIWSWVSTTYFTGYRSPLCGRPEMGHTISPLASEIDAIGGLLPKGAYSRLWGYARENNLVVTQSVWTANIGAHLFVDVDGTNFRAPDLRNMFLRYTGTDADTANARALGSKQGFSNAGHTHGTYRASGGSLNIPNSMQIPDADAIAGAAPGNELLESQRVLSSGGAEARGVNVAFHPRIHA